VKQHGIPDEVERIEAPVAISTLADEFSDLLEANDEMIDEVKHHDLRRHPCGAKQGHRQPDGRKCLKVQSAAIPANARVL
jgi:hypothetical protein